LHLHETICKAAGSGKPSAVFAAKQTQDGTSGADISMKPMVNINILAQECRCIYFRRLKIRITAQMNSLWCALLFGKGSCCGVRCC